MPFSVPYQKQSSKSVSSCFKKISAIVMKFMGIESIMLMESEHNHMEPSMTTGLARNCWSWSQNGHCIQRQQQKITSMLKTSIGWSSIPLKRKKLKNVKEKIAQLLGKGSSRESKASQQLFFKYFVIIIFGFGMSHQHSHLIECFNIWGQSHSEIISWWNLSRLDFDFLINGKNSCLLLLVDMYYPELAWSVKWFKDLWLEWIRLISLKDRSVRVRP